MSNLKILFSICCLLWASCGVVNQQDKKSTLENIKEEKILKVGYIPFPPCIYKNLQTQKLEGHFVLTIEEIAKEAGWKVQYVESDWGTFVAGLTSKRFDICIAPTFVTIPRSLSVSFSRPLMFAGNSAIVKKDDRRFTSIKSIDQSGITVAVTQGEAGAEYAKTNFTKAKIISSQGSDQSLTFQNVISGRADIALGDAYVTAHFAEQHPNEVTDLFATDPYNLTPVSWTVRTQDEDLLQFINSSLDALDTQGLLSEYEKQSNAHWLHIKKEYISK